MPETPKRRWFQFRLRTLLVGVAAMSCILGWGTWQFRIVSERRRLISAADETVLPDLEIGYVVSYACDDRAAIPFYRRWIGDAQYGLIVIDDIAPDDTLIRYRSWFPEAVVVRARDWIAGDAEFHRLYGIRPSATGILLGR